MAKLPNSTRPPGPFQVSTLASMDRQDHTRFDAIVVGGGPAGATAARTLARDGWGVLLLEKARLPRYKPCGGGITPRTVALLPFPLSNVPNVQVERISFRLRGGSPVDWDLPQDFPFFTVMRTDLDHELVRSARGAGARVHDGEEVRDLSWDGEEFTVVTAGGVYRSTYIVGADGATGIVRRALGISARGERGLAAECEIPTSPQTERRFGNRALFDVEAVPEGYGWVFPKRGLLSVGLGSARPAGMPMRELLRHYLLSNDLVPDTQVEETEFHLHPLPMATQGETVAAGNCLLTGDAAGIADGFCGEGICYSMASGELAAIAISQALAGNRERLESYSRDLDRLIRKDHGWAGLMGKTVRRFPDAAYRILTSAGEGKSVLIPLMMGQIGFGEALHRLPRLLALGRLEART